MWIFLNDAFVSIVAPRPESDFDPLDFLVVRGRIKGDIEKLFPGADIIEGGGTDYRFRAVIERGDVARVIVDHLWAIDYTNFKDTVTDHARHDAYLDVWTVMARLQRPRLGRV
jgi:hypothetical protein